ncbi:hypothetical protein AX16_000116 [Volvariella volvacea WC 439]|nr:hypothetical protein AX16_000116 [Volvariella volvacea WC 439]
MAETLEFDVIVLGTGLTESITAAALAKAGLKVAHIDSNSYYGGHEASLSLDELIQWADQNSSNTASGITSVTRSPNALSHARQYAICLCPSINPSLGSIISALVSSGVARYGSFRLLDRVALYSSGAIKSVPGSKEDVFKSKEISLIDKRRLMRFLMFAASPDFEGKPEIQGKEESPFYDFLRSTFTLNDDIASAIVYALALCNSPSEHTLPALRRLSKYLRSAGRYGPSPFLVGHYGGVGEIAQGFCRAAAVSGAVYILGRQISSVERSQDGSSYVVNIEGIPDQFTSRLIISSPHLLSSNLQGGGDVRGVQPSKDLGSGESHPAVARCIAILDKSLQFPIQSSTTEENKEEESPATEGEETSPTPPPTHIPVDTAVFVYPPGSLPQDGTNSVAVTAFITGEGSLATPQGKSILYLSLPLSDPPNPEDNAETLLKPYLDATLQLTNPPTTEPDFKLFYIQRHPSTPSATEWPPQSSTPSGQPKILVVPALPAVPLPETPDYSAQLAEDVFWEAVKALGRDAESMGESNPDEVIDSFWPPLPREDEEEDEDPW